MPHPDRHSNSERSRPGISPANLRAAQWLERLADDLELREPRMGHHIAAYKLAAVALRASPLRVEDLWSAGRERALTQIEHVTPVIAKLLGELITTKQIELPRRDPGRATHR